MVMMNKKEPANLPDDFARCNGVGCVEDGWREGCEHCLRRTAARRTFVCMIAPPPIIAFECEFLIDPNGTSEPDAQTSKL